MQLAKKDRVTVILSALWAIAALPLAYDLAETYYNDFTGNPFMQVFIYSCVISPILIFYGWRWTNGRELPWLIVLSSVAVGLILGVVWWDNRFMQEEAYIPLVIAGAFLLLQFQRRGWVHRKDSTRADMATIFEKAPSPGNIEKLLTECKPMIADYEAKKVLLRQFLSDKNLQPPISAIDIYGETALCSFAAVYCRFSTLRKSDIPHHMQIAAVLQTIMLECYLREARLLGQPFNDDEIKDPRIRKSAMKLIKLAVQRAEQAARNLHLSAPQALYPLYESFRPYIGRDVPEQVVFDTFNNLFEGFVRR